MKNDGRKYSQSHIYTCFWYDKFLAFTLKRHICMNGGRKSLELISNRTTTAQRSDMPAFPFHSRRIRIKHHRSMRIQISCECRKMFAGELRRVLRRRIGCIWMVGGIEIVYWINIHTKNRKRELTYFPKCSNLFNYHNIFMYLEDTYILLCVGFSTYDLFILYSLCSSVLLSKTTTLLENLFFCFSAKTSEGGGDER